MTERSRKRAPTDRAAGAPPEGAHACPVAFCPVSMLLTATGSVRPEVVEHLLAAGRELLLAMQAVMTARQQATPGGKGLEKIEIG